MTVLYTSSITLIFVKRIFATKKYYSGSGENLKLFLNLLKLLRYFWPNYTISPKKSG